MPGNRTSRRHMLTVFTTIFTMLMGYVVQTPEVYSALDGTEMCRVHHIVYHQGSCSACLAFATSTALGYRTCLSSNTDFIPSPFRLFDCLASSCNQGLSMEKVETARIHGIGDLKSTPAWFGWGCKYEDGATVSDWVSYSAFGEASMKSDIYYYGPAVANIFVDPMFYFYKSGSVYKLRNIETIPADQMHSLHAVVILGWGVDPEPHWVIQNSWGEHWGDGGKAKVTLGSITAHHCWRHDPYFSSGWIVLGVWWTVSFVCVLTATQGVNLVKNQLGIELIIFE